MLTMQWRLLKSCYLTACMVAAVENPQQASKSGESVRKAQKAQKRVHDRKSRELNLKIGERVFIYMPKEKACKAYKFARPLHGP